MGNQDKVIGEHSAAGPRSHLFTVRVWKEEATDRSEYRGSVRDVVTGSLRGFRDWSDLVAFMIEQVDEDGPGKRGAQEPTR